MARSRMRGWAIVGGVAMVGLAGVAIAVRGGVIGQEEIEVSGEPTTVIVADHEISLPRNVVRFSAQRRPGRQARLDLALSWPELEGRTPTSAARFSTTDVATDIVYGTITAAREGPDSAGRLATVYARFFSGAPFDGPGGLVGHRMAAKSGYEDEIVYAEPGVVHPFVARCYPLAKGEAPSVCLRDRRIGGNLTVEWRFPVALLGAWRELAAGLDGRLAAWGLADAPR